MQKYLIRNDIQSIQNFNGRERLRSPPKSNKGDCLRPFWNVKLSSLSGLV